MEKNYRKSVIAQILSTQKIHTQEELMEVLRQKGIEVTQATLSRDIKDLGAYKFTEPQGEFYYKCDGAGTAASKQGMSFSIDISGQMCVIHCKPGFAPALAALIDQSVIKGIMGTIAGDDTVLAILTEDADRSKIRSSVTEIFPYNG